MTNREKTREENIKTIIWGICDKHERMRCLLDLRDQLDKKLGMTLLGQVWQNVDNGEDYWPEVESWIRSGSKADPILMMDDEDWQAYQNLGTTKITIYRGGGPELRRSLDRCPAWTTDRKVADKFAYIESPLKPVVLQAKMIPTEAYGYFVGRKEAELLLSPQHCPSFKLQKVIRLEPKSTKFAAYTEFYKLIHRQGLGVGPMDVSVWHLLFSVADLEAKLRVLKQRARLLREYRLLTMAETQEALAQQTEMSIAERRAAGDLTSAQEKMEAKAAG